MTEINQTFETFDQWCNRASSWLTRRLPHERAICYDQHVNICRCGADFQHAKYPIHWIWPTQLEQAVQDHPEIAIELDALESEIQNFYVLPDLLDACQTRTLRYVIASQPVRALMKQVNKNYNL